MFVTYLQINSVLKKGLFKEIRRSFFIHCQVWRLMSEKRGHDISNKSGVYRSTSTFQTTPIYTVHREGNPQKEKIHSADTELIYRFIHSKNQEWKVAQHGTSSVCQIGFLDKESRDQLSTTYDHFPFIMVHGCMTENHHYLPQTNVSYLYANIPKTHFVTLKDFSRKEPYLYARLLRILKNLDIRKES